MSPDGDNGESVPAAPKTKGGQQANFGANLMQPGSSKSKQIAYNKLQEDYSAKSLPEGDNLASSLIHNLSTPLYPDSPTCFSAISNMVMFTFHSHCHFQPGAAATLLLDIIPHEMYSFLSKKKVEEAADAWWA